MRLQIAPKEAEYILWWLRAWQPAPAGLLALDPEAAESSRNAQIAMAAQLGRKFTKVVQRKRRAAKMIEVVVDRVSLQWLIGAATETRGMFGKVFPAQGFLPFDIQQKLMGAIGRRPGRQELSRTALEVGGFGSDPRHKKRLVARLRRQRLVDDWFERRWRAGRPTGLLSLFDADDPYPNLP